MRIRQWIDGILDFAAIPGEPDTMRGRRRLFVGVMWVSIPLLSFWTVIKLASGQPLSAATVGFQALLHLGALVAIEPPFGAADTIRPWIH
jgi:hypothetical protein